MKKNFILAAIALALVACGQKQAESENQTAEFIYYKISSDARTIASYYSLDGQQWQMVRLYANNYPERLYLGICSQAPQSDECISTFEKLSLTTDNVGDFRMGE